MRVLSDLIDIFSRSNHIVLVITPLQFPSLTDEEDSTYVRASLIDSTCVPLSTYYLSPLTVLSVVSLYACPISPCPISTCSSLLVFPYLPISQSHYAPSNDCYCLFCTISHILIRVIYQLSQCDLLKQTFPFPVSPFPISYFPLHISSQAPSLLTITVRHVMISMTEAASSQFIYDMLTITSNFLTYHRFPLFC